MTHSSSRRTVLAAGAAALVAAGCGSNDSAAPGAPSTPSGSSVPPSSPAGKSSAPAATEAAGVRELTTTADIPVGGGTVFTDHKVVVTQPVKGEFKAFSAVCTHQRCTLNQVADGSIHCPCHGSRFRVADGSVAQGPATTPLPAERITVEGNSIRLA
ncbi:Rieske (2Fe-2S) protein [Streptomyces sp. NPDC046831]|uniref:Rieske (2Fe-2S) protein n=1 Tax=Streptomyces sp. NPDC046831 TaxID=3154805 RepID=UPI0033D3A4F0